MSPDKISLSYSNGSSLVLRPDGFFLFDGSKEVQVEPAMAVAWLESWAKVSSGTLEDLVKNNSENRAPIVFAFITACIINGVEALAEDEEAKKPAPADWI